MNIGMTKAIASQAAKDEISKVGTGVDNVARTGVQEVKSELDEKANKNDVFTMANMGQDIKTAMTGGSVAVVGKGAVLSENIVAKQVIPYTTNFFDIKNFMDLSSVKFENKFVGADGVIKTDVGTIAIIFRVESNTKYKIKFNDIPINRGVVVSSNSDVFTLGSSYTVLSNVVPTGNILDFTTQANTSYVFVYFTNASLGIDYYNSNKNKIKLYKNDIPIDEDETVKKSYLPKDILYKELNSVNPEHTSFFDIYNLLLNNVSFITANCSTNGTVSFSSGKSYIVNCLPNTVYYIKLPINSNRAFVVSTSSEFINGNIYSPITLNDNGNKIYKFTTLSDTKKIMVYYNNIEANFDLTEFNMALDINNININYMINKQYLPPINDKYIGKKILTMGDSITAINEGTLDWDRSWRKYFKEIIKPSLFVNTAVPSATWRDKVGTIYDGNPVVNGIDNNINNVMGNQMEKVLRGKDTTHPNYSKVADYDDFDMIIIACGTNDTEWVLPTQSEIETQFFNGSTPITDLKSLDKKSWTGALRYTVDSLRRLYPNAKIYLCTPIQRTGNKYDPILAKNKIIKDVCRRLSIDIIDTMICGIYDMTCPTGGQEGDYNDGLHLSPQGASKMGKYIANEVKNKYY